MSRATASASSGVGDPGARRRHARARTYQRTVISATSSPSPSVSATAIGKRTRPSRSSSASRSAGAASRRAGGGDRPARDPAVGDLGALGQRRDVRQPLGERGQEGRRRRPPRRPRTARRRAGSRRGCAGARRRGARRRPSPGPSSATRSPRWRLYGIAWVRPSASAVKSMARHPNRRRSGTMRPVSEARDVYVRRRLAALGTVGVVALAAGALVGAGGGSGGGRGEASCGRRAHGAPDAAAGRPADLPRPARRRLLRRAAGPRAGRAGHRHARPGGAPGSSAPARPYAQRRRPVLPALELLATVANRDAGHRRPLPHAPGRPHDPPLPAGRAAPPRAARPRHPARARRLPRRGPAPRALAARAGRRARARPRVAHAAARCPGRGSARSRRPRSTRSARYVAGLVRARPPAREALRRPPVHRGHGHRQARGGHAARAWP